MGGQRFDLYKSIRSVVLGAAPALLQPAAWGQAPAPAEPAKTAIQELAADLERLDRLRQQGLLKEDEYQALKEQVIRKATQKP